MLAGPVHRLSSLDQWIEGAGMGDANAPAAIDPGFDLVFDQSLIEHLLGELPPCFNAAWS